MKSLESIKSIHVIGICGTLMGSFAAFMQRRGVTVTGSDQNIYPPMSEVLQMAGVKLFEGYSAENLKKISPDLVVIGNVVSKSNLEAQYAIESGLSYTSLPEAMENLFLRETRNIVVSGTHGKTTTSSIMAYVLTTLKKDPSYFIGGVPADLPFSFNVTDLKNGSFFVLEGDEYDTAFWDKVPKFNHYLPDDVILTSVEFDHVDIYKDLAAVESAFIGLMERVRPGGQVIACIDFLSVPKILKYSKVPVITYSSRPNMADYFPVDIESREGILSFGVCLKGSLAPIDQISIQIPGVHNVMNVLSVYILARVSNWDMNLVKKALMNFKGIKRRQEERGEVSGVLVIDDFAHHPTAVAETLKALKMKYKGRRLLTVFEPRSATSRRKVFQKDYVEAFLNSDYTWIATPYDQSKIDLSDQFSTEELVRDLKAKNKTASLFKTVDEGVAMLKTASQKGDLIAVLSNGGFGGFIPKLLDSLQL